MFFHETWVDGIHFNQKEQSVEHTSRDFKWSQKEIPMPGRMVIYQNEDWNRDDPVFSKQVTDEFIDARSLIKINGQAPKIKQKFV